MSIASKIVVHMPHVAAARYKLWLRMIRRWGPDAIRSVSTFRDVPILKSGSLRSSWLSTGWRVVYAIDGKRVRAVIRWDILERSNARMGQKEYAAPPASKRGMRPSLHRARDR